VLNHIFISFERQSYPNSRIFLSLRRAESDFDAVFCKVFGFFRPQKNRFSGFLRAKLVFDKAGLLTNVSRETLSAGFRQNFHCVIGRNVSRETLRFYFESILGSKAIVKGVAWMKRTKVFYYQHCFR